MLLEWVTERAVEGEEVSKEVGGHVTRPGSHGTDSGFDSQHDGSYRSTEECRVAAVGRTWWSRGPVGGLSNGPSEHRQEEGDGGEVMHAEGGFHQICFPAALPGSPPPELSYQT